MPRTTVKTKVKALIEPVLDLSRCVRWIFTCVFLVAGFFGESVFGEEQLKINLVAVTPELQLAAEKALNGVSPSKKEIRDGINKNCVYALTGNVFGDGNSRAVLDINGNVVLCLWRKDRWEPLVFFGNMAANWLHAGCSGEVSEGYKPVSKKPFWIVQLQGYSLLVVATEPDKYAQNYDVFLLDGECRRIVAHADSYRRPPNVVCDHLVTEDGSRRKAIWGATYYSRIERNLIVIQKSWGEYVPYNESEEKPPYYYASCNGQGYEILWGDSDEKGSAECVIYKKDLPRTLGEILKPGSKEKVYAKIFLRGKKGENLQSDTSLGSSDIPESTLAYLFEKLTGLPRKLYKEKSEAEPVKALESLAVIRIEGDPEAMERLSPHASGY